MKPLLKMTIAGAALLCGAMSTVVVGEDRPSASSIFAITLKPLLGTDHEVSAVAVTESLPGEAGDEALSFAAAVTYANVTHVADRIQALRIRDAEGPVPVQIEEDKPAPGGFPYYRHWKTARAVHYPVQVSYLAGVQPPGSPNGPAFGIRPAGAGVSGSGGGFLLLPEHPKTSVIKLRWDLSGMAPGAVASTTLGDGDFTVAGDTDKLVQSWVMAGPARQYAPQGRSRFHAFWLGRPPFDAEEAMTWAAKAYEYMSGFYSYLSPPPAYRVYLRALSTPPYGGGTALQNSFMLSMGPSGPKGNLKETIFHEMSHQWVGSIDGPQDQIAWYVEGLNVFYTTLLPLRSGLLPVEDYQQSINDEARKYYTSPARNWSAAEIGHAGFGDEDIRSTPYNRGALYWADLDFQIRQASHGKRTLDDLFRPIWAARARGERFDQAVFEAHLARELGRKAVEAFRQAMIEGKADVAPASGAFGPCFVRHETTFQGPKGPVQGYLWDRVPNVADESCRRW